MHHGWLTCDWHLQELKCTNECTCVMQKMLLWHTCSLSVSDRSSGNRPPCLEQKSAAVAYFPSVPGNRTKLCAWWVRSGRERFKEGPQKLEKGSIPFVARMHVLYVCWKAALFVDRSTVKTVLGPPQGAEVLRAGLLNAVPVKRWRYRNKKIPRATQAFDAFLGRFTWTYCSPWSPCTKRCIGTGQKQFWTPGSPGRFQPSPVQAITIGLSCKKSAAERTIFLYVLTAALAVTAVECKKPQWSNDTESICNLSIVSMHVSFLKPASTAATQLRGMFGSAIREPAA